MQDLILLLCTIFLILSNLRITQIFTVAYVYTKHKKKN